LNLTGVKIYKVIMNYSGLIIGLGNPGNKYASTRHNIGFMVIETLLESKDPPKINVKNTEYNKKLYKLWKVNLEDAKQDWLVCAPLTYMNLSGKAVNKLCKKYGFRPDQIIVVHDELDLSFGKLRLKYGGGLSGHNGLLSIAQELGSRDFYRLRMGIGRPGQGNDIVDYVLSKFSKQESDQLKQILDKAATGLYSFCTQGMQQAMNLIH